MRVVRIVVIVFFIIGVSACQKQEILSPSPETKKDLTESLVMVDLDLNKEVSSFKAAKTDGWWVDINESLAEHKLRLEKMETYGADEAGVTFYFKDLGNKQLDSDFAPNDPRNDQGTSVPYMIDGVEQGTSSGMEAGETINAIESAMNTWDELSCSSGLDIPSAGVFPFDIGFVQFLEGYGGYPGYLAGGILLGGILPPEFFEAIGGPGGGNGILGVTFTFIWLEDDSGEPSDINRDGKADVAIKEIYFNDHFYWVDNPDDELGGGGYDFETVVLHEVGHGLCQAHFGKAFRSGNGKLHFSPYALMNPIYSVGNREVTKTDLAGHCSIWANWPQH